MTFILNFWFKNVFICSDCKTTLTFKLLKERPVCMLQIDWRHNHPIKSLMALTFRDVAPSTASVIKGLFEQGYSAGMQVARVWPIPINNIHSLLVPHFSRIFFWKIKVLSTVKVQLRISNYVLFFTFLNCSLLWFQKVLICLTTHSRFDFMT